MKIFNLDNPIHKNALKLVEFIQLSLLMLVSAIPLVTFGTAFSAGYYTYHKVFISEDERSLSTIYFTSFKENLKNTLAVSILSIVIMMALYVNQQAAEKGLVLTPAFKYLSMVMMVLFATFMLTYLCYNARFNNTVKNLIKTSFASSFLHFPTFIMLLAVVIISYLLVTIIPITFLILPVVMVLASHVICEQIFKFYIPAEASGNPQ